ncbi:MAG: hypothetical protein IT342_08795 [Candidatus Melainabacteria bacterium]|nr:hypothetical protein [Candidatus Melainabacteria bacterium]
MRQNLCCHKVANESPFIGLAVTLLTVITTVACSAVWPSIILLLTLRAAHDFSKCSYVLIARSRNTYGHHLLQPFKV